MFRKTFFILTILFLFVALTQEALAFYFSLSLDPQSGSIDKGGTLKTAINLYSASSDWENSWEGVSLFSAVEPKGVRISFSPYYCRPACSLVMIISVSEEAESKNYSIPIIATGKGVTRKASYQLTITSSQNPLEIIKDRNALLAEIQAQIDAIRLAIFRLQKQLMELISAGKI